MSESAVTSELNASSLMAKDACRTGVTAATLNDPARPLREIVDFRSELRWILHAQDPTLQHSGIEQQSLSQTPKGVKRSDVMPL